MTRTLQIALALLLISAASADADCFVDYKAKRSDNGLQLHYGVVQLNEADCANQDRMKRAVADRIGIDGWTVLRVISRVPKDELSDRKPDAGQYFLRY